MNVFKRGILTLLSFIFATSAIAHVRWDSNGLITERAPNYTSCAVPPGDSPTLLRSGARISVTFEVAVTHGEPYRIEFSPANDQGFEDNLLKGNIPEQPGLTTVSITLPNVECEACSLRVYGGGYVSCADIRLTATGLPDVNPEDVTAPSNISSPNSTASDKQIILNWSNPAEDFYETLILQSQSVIDAIPTDGTAYVTGDVIGDSVVIYKGDNASATAMNLTMDTGYYFKIFSYDDSINYAPGIQHQVTTTNIGNTAPSIALNVLQSVLLSLDVYRDRGLVVVQSIISDADENDAHTTDWSETDLRLIDTDNNDLTYTFDPSSLETGAYSVKLNVADNGTPTLESSAELTIIVFESTALPTPTPTPSPTSTPVVTTTPIPASSGSSSGGGSFGTTSLLVVLLLLFIRKKRKCSHN